MIPGSNLLAEALTVLGQKQALHYAATGRTKDATGKYVTAYAAPVPRFGSWQAVPREKYEHLGLDWQKQYFNFYCSGILQDVQRGESVDYLIVDGERYNCLSATPWGSIDGWTHMLCVRADK